MVLYGEDITWLRGFETKVDWSNAGDFCRSIKGRLPSIQELRKTQVLCGGREKRWKSNQKDSDYHRCIQNKGFTLNGFYWSSDDVDGGRFAWINGFYFGEDELVLKNSLHFVNCVKVEIPDEKDEYPIY